MIERGERGRGSATKAGWVADTLREWIANGTIARGTRLYQGELAEQFATSITPIREALKQLQAEGLLVGEPHRGVRVAAPDVEEISSIYIMRRLLEPHAARRAAPRLSRRDIDRARRINERFAQLAPSDVSDAPRLNRDFHFVIYGACGLPTLASEIQRLWTGFPWAALQVQRGSAASSVTEHEHIIDAVSGGDHDDIQRHFELHIRHGFEALMRHIGVVLESDPFADAT